MSSKRSRVADESSDLSELEEEEETRRPFSKEIEIPKEVFALILDFASQGQSSRLVEFASVSKYFYSIALPLLHKHPSLGGFSQVNRFAKYKRTKKGKEIETETSSLNLELETIYPPSLTSSVSSLRSIFTPISSSLTCLHISVPPPSHNPLPHLFTPSLSSLTQLSQLVHFSLKGGEIWFHDLVQTLFPAWSNLVSFETSILRGDCNRPLPSLSKEEEESMPKLRKIVVEKSSTLTGRMVKVLLGGQRELKWLEMSLPGGKGSGEVEGRIAWGAIEELVGGRGGEEEAEEGGEGNKSGLEVLKVWDRWGEQTVALKRKELLHQKKVAKEKKGVGSKTKTGVKGKQVVTAADGDEEGEETDQLASDAEDDQSDSKKEEEKESEESTHSVSPFLSILSRPNSLRSLFLTVAYLPSSPAPDSFLELLPHLSSLVQLTIEDTNISGLRGMVQSAIKKKKLPKLRELISVGIKKRAVRSKAAATTKKKEGGGGKDLKKGKGKSKSKAVESESEEDELDSSDNGEGDSDEDEKKDEKKKKMNGGRIMSKTELAFYEFCKSKKIDWKIKEDWKA